MADNAAQSIKELQERLVSADKTIGEMLQRLGKYESWVSLIFTDIAQNAKVSIDEIGDYLTKKMRRENLKQSESLMKDILGIEDAKKEVEKVPTMFERVINEINAKAANKRGFWANELFHSEFAVEQAKKNFARVYREFAEAKNAPIAMAQASFAPELERLSSIDQSILSKTDLKKLQERIAQVKSDLASISKLQVGGEAYKDPSLLEALKRYQDALEKVRQVKEQIEALNGKEGNRYAANASMVEGVTRKFNENEQALAKLQQRWEELNVKKQAGLISQKDFDAQTQKILDEYDRLIAKRKEFEIGDLGQMSYQRKSEREQEEERLAQLRKSNTQARLDDEMRAEKMIKAERAKREAKENAAIREQVSNYKQLSALLKQYNSLKQVKGRTQEEESALERTRQKIKEIIAEMRKLDSEQKGSLGKARDITEYDRILAKDREITNEKKKQNDLTKQQKANLSSLLPTLQRLASAFGIAFSVRGLAQFGKKLIETRGEFERQQVALRSILQNKQLADEIWDKTMQAALQSPFTAMQLTTYTKQLAAYRIETDKLFETTKRLADVSAGLGVDMQRLILAYGQVKAANYLRASEIRQFTEAGVNVLGELRDYFNDVKGMSVDTAQVMEMVTKRLVTFEDVEAIFKRMTDQGGIFYEMQYVQSQTVRGQIAKLHDAYDQMLNSIGQANEGALKNMVSLLNSIVKNWQEFKTVIDLIAWPLLISFVYKFSRGLMTTAAESVATSASMNKLTVAGAKTQLMFKRLFASIAAHPFIALGAAVAAVGVALLNHAKHVKDINKRYEDLMLRTYETQKNLNGLSETIQNNLDTMKEAAKGSEAYNEASRENENIVKKLKDQYPELLQGIDLQKDGYKKLIEKIKEYNEELENNIRLEYAARAGFWQDDLTTNIADLQEAQRKREMQFLQNRNLAETEYLKNGKKDNDIWWERIRLAKTWEEQVDIINRQNEAARGGGFSLQFYGFVVPGVGGLGGGSVETNLANLSNNIKQEALVLNDIIRDQLKTINEDLGDDIQQFITDNETQINELFKDKEGAGWKLLNKQITKFFTAKGATDKETREAIQNLLNEYLLVPIQLDWDNISSISGKQNPPKPPKPEKTHENASKLISLIKEMRGEYDKLSKSAYGYAKSEEKVREAYAQSVEKILGKAGVTKDYDFTTNEGMIAALNKVLAYANKLGPEAAAEVQKYIDQLETEIEINAQVRIREDFGKQMEKAFGDYELTLDIEKLNLPSDVLADMFDIETVDLSDLRNKVVQFYEERAAIEADPTELVKQVEGYYKKIDDMERKQQRERIKEYAKYLEYELSERAKIEMEYVRKLAEVETTRGLTNEQKDTIDKRLKKERDENLAKQEWEDFKSSETYIQMMEDLEHQGVGALEVMRQELERIRANAANLSPRALKEVVNALEKINEITIKRGMPIGNIIRANAGIASAKESAIGAGLEKEQVESRKAARETLENIKKTILEREKEYRTLSNELGVEKELARLESERTKNNAKMEAMFGDTFAAESDEQIQQRIAEAVGNIETSRKKIAEYQEQAKEADEETLRTISTKVAEEESNLACLLAERGLLEDALRLRLAIAKAEANRGNLTDEERKHLQERVEQLEEELKSLQAQAGAVGSVTKAYGILGDTVQDAFQKMGQWGQQLSSTFDSFKTMMESFGTDTETSTWDTLSASFSMLDTVASTAASAAAKFTAGDYIGGALDVLNGLINIVTKINELHDKGYEREIERQQKRIESLQRAYERLEKQIEKTWSTVSYIRTYREETQNLYEQIDALNMQMAAEEAKKNTDTEKMQGYQDAIDDAMDKLEELKQQQIETFGGIGENSYRSAAEGFVDAWKSAFLETGDGLQGLQEHFDEFLNDWFVKQATMRVAGGMLEPLFRQIDSAVDQYSNGDANVLMQELQEVREKFGVLAPQLSEALEGLAGMWGLGGEGSLSGLAAGIQGMTEEQANILEAYWNSVRGYTASIDMNVARIAEILGGGRDTRNPQLTYLESIARNTGAIYSLFQSVLKGGHAENGMGIKVFEN